MEKIDQWDLWKIQQEGDPFYIPCWLYNNGRILCHIYGNRILATPTEKTIYRSVGFEGELIGRKNLLDYPQLIPHLLKPLREYVLETKKKKLDYERLRSQGINPKNAFDAVNYAELYNESYIEYLKKRGKLW